MGDVEGFRRIANPLLLNMQKMELELTCPACLNLLRKPNLLPCNHLICSVCVTVLAKNGCECSVCKEPFCEQDLRPSSSIEALTTIFKSLNSIIGGFIKQGPQIGCAGKSTAIDGSPSSGNRLSEAKLKLCKTDQEFSNKNPSVEAFGILNIGKTNQEESNYEAKTEVAKKVTRNATAQPYFGLHTPESYTEQKDSDYDSNYSGSEPRGRRSPIKCLSKRDLNSQMLEDSVPLLKKPKLTDNADVVDIHNNVSCAFCLTSETTEASGPMLHLLHGKQMKGNDAMRPGVLHVHERCSEWAPQVFFSGDDVLNVEVELVRASKMKCSSCGLKGAALGCYVKSCRKSYHVPCAAKIPDCRWDNVNFVLLCPTHSSRKLPSDIYKKKSLANGSLSHASSTLTQTPSVEKQDVSWTGSASSTRDWLLCGSGLSTRAKDILAEFVSLTGVATTNSWRPNITHVIAETDEQGACTRTLKLLMAILAGKWVLNVEWLKACIKSGHPVPEEPYEISHDVHGTFDGPKTGRLRAANKEPMLFAGLSFYFCAHFKPAYKGHLESLVLAAGGVVSEEENICPTTFIVYSTDPTQEGDQTDLPEIIKNRKDEAEGLAARTSSNVIPHTWLLDTIAACQLPQNL